MEINIFNGNQLGLKIGSPLNFKYFDQNQQYNDNLYKEENYFELNDKCENLLKLIISNIFIKIFVQIDK